jgi:adenylate cyclase
LIPIIQEHFGRAVKTMGDVFLVEFSSVLGAVRCAHDIQLSASGTNMSLPKERRIHPRVGVHPGDVMESEGDILGDVVNLASRIQSVAGLE